MALVTITDVIKDANGDFPTSGTITFRLSDWLTNSTGKIIVPTNEVTNVSAVDGTFTTTLESTLDATPGTRTYAVTFTGTLDGSVVTISLGSIAVAATPASQDLSDLLNTGTSTGNGISNVQTLALSSVEPRITFYETDQAVDTKYWDIDVNNAVLTMRTRTDANGTGITFLTVTRGLTTAISSLNLLGPVGIGGTPTTGQLDVFGGGTLAVNARIAGASGGVAIQAYDSTNLVVRGSFGYGSNVFTGAVISDLGVRSEARLVLATQGTVAMTIDTAQRVGIGAAPIAGNAQTLSMGSTMVFQNIGSSQFHAGSNAYFDGVSWKYAQTGTATAIRYNAASDSAITFHIAASGISGTTITGWDTSNIQFKVNNVGQVVHTDGSAAAPSISFINDTGTGFNNVSTYGHIGVSISGAIVHSFGGSDFRLGSGINLSWSSATNPQAAIADTILTRDAANILALKNGTNPQEFRVYQTTVGPVYGRILAAGGQTLIQSVGGSIGLSISGVAEWDINSSAHFVPSSDNVLDLGNSTTNRVRSGYFGTSVNLNIAGAGLFIKEGVNATMGTGTLVGGTLTVSTTKITANSRIFLSHAGGGVIANLGVLYIASRTAGVSFVVSSSNSLDTSSFVWMIVEPA